MQSKKTTLCIPWKAYFQVKLFASIHVVYVAYLYLLFYFLRATAKYKFEFKPTRIYRSFISLPNGIVWIVLMRPFPCQGQHLYVVYPFRVDNCHFVFDNRLEICVHKKFVSESTLAMKRRPLSRMWRRGLRASLWWTMVGGSPRRRCKPRSQRCPSQQTRFSSWSASPWWYLSSQFLPFHCKKIMICSLDLEFS